MSENDEKQPVGRPLMFGEGPQQVISMRLPANMIKALDKIAERDGVTRNQAFRKAIEAYIARRNR